MLSALLLAAALVLPPAPLEQRLKEATVTLLPGICAGAVARDRDHVITAAHCVVQRTGAIPVAFSNGESALATPEAILYDQDVAVLRLDRSAPFEPLQVSPGLPPPGTTVYFAGRHDHPDDSLQEAVVQRLGPCPSLPRVPAALHTSIRGEPGDSGAPLVDAELRIVGLVHGGARCSIATPAAPAAELLAAMASGGAQCVGPTAPNPEELGVGGSGPATP